MAYVEDACDQCGLILPRSQLREWTDTVEVARASDTTQLYANGAVGAKQGKVTYRTRHVSLCPDCYAGRVAAETERERAAQVEREDRLADQLERNRATRRKWVLGVSLAALVVALGVAGVALHLGGVSSPIPPGLPADAANTTENVMPETPPGDNTATDAAASEAAPQTGLVTTNEAPRSTPMITPAPLAVPALPPATPPAAPPTPVNTPALSSAVAAALNSGESTPWSSGAHSGVVSVGQARVYGDRPCRQFGYSVDGARSGLTIACRSPDGLWRPNAASAIAP